MGLAEQLCEAGAEMKAEPQSIHLAHRATYSVLSHSARQPNYRIKSLSWVVGDEVV